MSEISTSICILSRPTWPIGLDRCLASIEEKTEKMDEVEVLVKVDHDAPELTFQILDKYRDRIPLKPIIMDGLWRREDIAIYCNILGWNSRGKLIWHWSDEVRLVTPSWDQVLKPVAEAWWDKPWSLYPLLKSRGPRCVYYPAITRRMHDLMGRFTYHICLDSWIDIITGPLRAHAVTGKIAHLGVEGLGEPRTRTIQEMERMPVEISQEHYSDSPHELQLTDTCQMEQEATPALKRRMDITDLNEPWVQDELRRAERLLLADLQKKAIP